MANPDTDKSRSNQIGPGRPSSSCATATVLDSPSPRRKRHGDISTGLADDSEVKQEAPKQKGADVEKPGEEEHTVTGGEERKHAEARKEEERGQAEAEESQKAKLAELAELRRKRELALRKLRHANPPDEFMLSVYIESTDSGGKYYGSGLARCLGYMYLSEAWGVSFEKDFFHLMVYEPFQRSLRFFMERVEAHIIEQKVDQHRYYDTYLAVYRRLRERSRAGLLRKGQVLLVLAAVESGLDSLADILAHSENDNRGRDLLIAVESHISLLFSFVSSSKFRSERLEILLLKYLAEEDVNMDVARAVATATASVYNSGEHWHRGRGNL
ncbi:hypothetical protein BJ508DRAFT_414837 [Ascobolus immersus RN42]|uniref:Uncharacterized protein n=1 Tax=Ascobolus immersus RN42 TaxID=1160509 RepID=A0A3N4I5N9_ASCIM|nr:hypothetical protein BJ508DRAFT_414837 [Ascobolus immersus RN42]